MNNLHHDIHIHIKEQHRNKQISNYKQIYRNNIQPLDSFGRDHYPEILSFFFTQDGHNGIN